MTKVQFTRTVKRLIIAASAATARRGRTLKRSPRLAAMAPLPSGRKRRRGRGSNPGSAVN
jgi:hypothetical protein